MTTDVNVSYATLWLLPPAAARLIPCKSIQRVAQAQQNIPVSLINQQQSTLFTSFGSHESLMRLKLLVLYFPERREHNNLALSG